MERLNIDNILKESAPVTILAICVKERAQANKFLVLENGLVEYGDEELGPEVAFERFVNETPLLTVIRGEVMTRIIEPQPNGKNYRWQTINLIKK